jgi:hypothetical protein
MLACYVISLIKRAGIATCTSPPANATLSPNRAHVWTSSRPLLPSFGAVKPHEPSLQDAAVEVACVTRKN